MSETVIKIEGLGKKYLLGEIGTGRLSNDLQRAFHKWRYKEDPYSVIDERHTGKNSNEIWAVRDINLEICKGDILGIIGRNGAGKSTLLKLISRITAPTCGSICINGKIATLLEVGTGMHPEMTARENIFLNGTLLGMSRSDVELRIVQILEFAGVQQYIDTPVKRFSSGMKTRLGFSVAAHLEPDILIVDEVLAVGDVSFQRKCLGKMQDIVQAGRTVIFVSHNMSSIRNLCQSVVLIDEGKILFNGDVGEGINRYMSLNINEDETGTNFEYSEHERNNVIKKINVVSARHGLIEFEVDAIDIKVNLNLDNTKNDLFLVIILEDSCGNNILTSSSNELEVDPLENCNGTVDLSIKIPGKILKPEKYYLTFSLRSKDGDIKHKIEKAVTFEVIDSSTYRGMKNLYRKPALVAPVVQFQLV